MHDNKALRMLAQTKTNSLIFVEAENVAGTRERLVAERNKKLQKKKEQKNDISNSTMSGNKCKNRAPKGLFSRE